MKKVSNICILVICMIGLLSCRGNSGQKAVQMAKKYIGKTVTTTKKLHLENHADDVARIKFVTVRCKNVTERVNLLLTNVANAKETVGFIR